MPRSPRAGRGRPRHARNFDPGLDRPLRPLGETVEISDTAELTELIPTQPGDTITFWLVGPVSGAPPECGSVVDPVIGPLAQPLDPATATATTGPQPFTPVAAGDYYWIAQYTGDANNDGAIGVCPDAAELVTVPPAMPTLATQASPATGTLGVSTQDTATVVRRIRSDRHGDVPTLRPGRPGLREHAPRHLPRRRSGRRDRDLARGRHRSRGHLPMGGDVQRRREQHAGDRLLRRSNGTHHRRCTRRTGGPRNGSSEPEPAGPEPEPSEPGPSGPGPPGPSEPTGVLPSTGFSSTFTIWFGRSTSPWPRSSSARS